MQSVDPSVLPSSSKRNGHREKETEKEERGGGRGWNEAPPPRGKEVKRVHGKPHVHEPLAAKER